MADKFADNAKYAGDVFYWTNLGSDTAVVYKYVCPVDSHLVMSVVRLEYNSSGVKVATQICPLHAAALTSEQRVVV